MKLGLSRFPPMIQKILRREFDIFTELWSKYQVTEISLLRELFEEIAECTEEEHSHITDHIYAFMLSQCISIEHHFQEIEAAFVHNFAKKMTELIGIERSEQVSYEPFLKQVETLREASIYRPNKYWIEDFVADQASTDKGLVLNTISDKKISKPTEAFLEPITLSNSLKSGGNPILEGAKPKAQIITPIQELAPPKTEVIQPKLEAPKNLAAEAVQSEEVAHKQPISAKVESIPPKAEPTKPQVNAIKKPDAPKLLGNPQTKDLGKLSAPTNAQQPKGSKTRGEASKGHLGTLKGPLEINSIELNPFGPGGMIVPGKIKKFEYSANEVSKMLGITIDVGALGNLKGESTLSRSDFEKIAHQIGRDSFHPRADVERLANLKGHSILSKQDAEKLANLRGEPIKVKRSRIQALDDDPQCIVSDTSSDDDEECISFSTMVGKPFKANNFEYTVYDFANQSKRLVSTEILCVCKLDKTIILVGTDQGLLIFYDFEDGRARATQLHDMSKAYLSRLYPQNKGGEDF